MKKALVVAGLGAAIALGSLVGAGTASALAPNCQSQPWGFLGSQTRQICDSPIRPDGSWTRERIIGRAGYYQNAHSSCSYGTYSGGCTYYPAGWVDEYHSSEDVYIVFPYNVLPDEPGHLG